MARPGNGERQRDDLLDRARQPIVAQMQRVGRGNADDQRDAERGERDQERAENRVGVELPHLHHPLQRHAGLNAAKIIDGDAGHHGQHRRHDQKGRDQKREQKLAGEDQAVAHGDGGVFADRRQDA